MGLLGNILGASIVHHHNNRRNQISRRLVDFVPQRGNIILCGGSSDEHTIAYDIKVELFIEEICRSAENKVPAVCVCTEQVLKEEIDSLPTKLRNNICVFGEDCSYIPFDKNIDSYKVEQMMTNLVSNYNKKISSYDASIQITMSMLLDILKNCFSQDYYTFQNLEVIVSHLIKYKNLDDENYNYSGEEEFLQWLESATSYNMQPYENQLSLVWNSSLTSFFNFWKEISSEIGMFQKQELVKRSLFSCMLDKKTCVFKVSSNYNKNIMEFIFNELAFYRDYNHDYSIVTYNANVSDISRYQLLDSGRSVFIGNTLSTIGINNIVSPETSVVCLGINSNDATGIFEKMVVEGWRIQTNIDFSHHSHVGFTYVQQKPITPDVLVNINDGSAYIVNRNGYRQVDILIV